jgi:hypothetical protein
MTTQIIVLAVAVPVILLPVAFIGYITVGGLWQAHRARVAAARRATVGA